MNLRHRREIYLKTATGRATRPLHIAVRSAVIFPLFTDFCGIKSISLCLLVGQAYMLAAIQIYLLRHGCIRALLDWETYRICISQKSVMNPFFLRFVGDGFPVQRSETVIYQQSVVFSCHPRLSSDREVFLSVRNIVTLSPWSALERLHLFPHPLDKNSPL